VPGATREAGPASSPSLVAAEDGTIPAQSEEAAAEILMDEVRRAESKFPAGYVGVNFFVTRWQGSQLDPDPEVRRRLIDRLVREERVEIYTTEDGTKAMRVKRLPGSTQSPRSVPPLES
jgi:hypothetical protein